MEDCNNVQKLCSDGTLLSADPENNCEFPPCGGDDHVCNQDVKLCPDGTYVGRDASNNCEFLPCPVSLKTVTKD